MSGEMMTGISPSVESVTVVSFDKFLKELEDRNKSPDRSASIFVRKLSDFNKEGDRDKVWKYIEQYGDQETIETFLTPYSRWEEKENRINSRIPNFDDDEWRKWEEMMENEDNDLFSSDESEKSEGPTSLTPDLRLKKNPIKKIDIVNFCDNHGEWDDNYEFKRSGGLTWKPPEPNNDLDVQSNDVIDNNPNDIWTDDAINKLVKSKVVVNQIQDPEELERVWKFVIKKCKKGRGGAYPWINNYKKNYLSEENRSIWDAYCKMSTNPTESNGIKLEEKINLAKENLSNNQKKGLIKRTPKGRMLV